MKLKSLLLLAALATAGANAQAELITFNGISAPPQFLPWTYDGLGLDPSITLESSSAGLNFPSGSQAILGTAGPAFITLKTPSVLSSIEFGGWNYYFSWDEQCSLVISGYRNGVKVASQVFNPVRDGADYQWFTADASFTSAIDTLEIDGKFDTRFNQWSVDAINLAPVPEPETWALMGLGAMAVLARRKAGKASTAVPAA
ncbi:PEP-CTERM sorting domain-containing protein [Amantichitinum ursilacus]|uniref:PEP-CTERM motif protein n=1 Tax=Amantichitinum ursilacus TaxID=857265 RepID=A0A0N0GR78_9NEIS|nr:PEP-CTERM sorting domain-containing protein [Amantichitinum ursilacus]KPC55179.1 PEP-CTERM motif protein [Amantichitinum ursilacus]